MKLYSLRELERLERVKFHSIVQFSSGYNIVLLLYSHYTLCRKQRHSVPCLVRFHLNVVFWPTELKPRHWRVTHLAQLWQETCGWVPPESHSCPPLGCSQSWGWTSWPCPPRSSLGWCGCYTGSQSLRDMKQEKENRRERSRGKCFWCMIFSNISIHLYKNVLIWETLCFSNRKVFSKKPYMNSILYYQQCAEAG